MDKLEFSIYCYDCGTKLSTCHIEGSEYRGVSYESLLPCVKCMKKSYDAGYKDGYDWAQGGKKLLEGEGEEMKNDEKV